ncbi:bifunctional 2-polyprenyl-6-hydroxyphenol methylase/3-demethylubiquinol 3-O-methyltransferase UbiG [uncultured Aquimarina sp.]|uniref:class I SAM-dependent methyltransferase n=1 Tax=uncultured Aquimarina sp. TaxID=575652 RepID=UPI00263842AA|nr:class I SAM-dependent methyltransferase [uncultured Aquimarina sp.]
MKQIYLGESTKDVTIVTTKIVFMMHTEKLRNELGNIDIYILDQLLKERYSQNDKILDAGCGSGRNIHWFYKNRFNVYAVDKEIEQIEYLKLVYPDWSDQFCSASLEQLPYNDTFFDHIICSAVLHFATSTNHFRTMFSELIRVLKPTGSLFIRMTSDIGIENKVTHLKEGVYRLGDESDRFLLTKDLLSLIMDEHQLSFLEPLKSTNVHDLRSMSTLVLQKNG